jgi:hypothetical protein
MFLIPLSGMFNQRRNWSSPSLGEPVFLKE